MNNDIASVPNRTPVEAGFSMTPLTEAQILQRRSMSHYTFAGALLAMTVVTWNLPVTDPALPGFLNVLLRSVIVLVGLFFVAQLFVSIPLLRLVHYEWMLPSQCDKLAGLCEQNAALNAYRDKVLALGRRFTAGEYFAMTAWAEKHEVEVALANEEARADAGCKRLYGIAQV